MHPAWSQPYTLFGHGIAVSALIAALPTLLLLYMLAVRRKASWIAALSGLGATLLLALFAYRMSVRHALAAAADGAAFGLFPITWIVFWALVLYEIAVVTGSFEIVKDSIGAITSDPRLQSLLIAFAFGAFLEGCAGFGAPVAVASAMMVGLGYSALYASSLCLLANTAPVAFGSVGIPIVTLAGITGLPIDRIHGVAGLSGVAGHLTAPLSLMLPAYLILVTSGLSAMLEVWPAVLTCGVVFASVQFTVSNFLGPQLADILSSIAAMAALVLLLRLWHPRRAPTGEAPAAMPTPAHRSTRDLCLAWTPYALLVVFVLAWGYPGFAAILNRTNIPIPWPALHNEILRMPPVVRAPAVYPAIFNLNWLASSGTGCLLACCAAAAFARMGLRAFAGVILSVARKLVRPTVTVAAMLAMAFVMNYSGATGTLGLAFSATGRAFPFFSPIMGWLGVFLTGSDTSSNALFGNLQVVSAARLGFNPILIAAANSVGGVMGKMISLQTIAVAAAATGLSVADQSRLFRFTLRHSIFLAALVGCEVMLYAYLIHPL
jgi:lactate permease